MCRRVLGCGVVLLLLLVAAVGLVYYDLTRSEAPGPGEVDPRVTADAPAERVETRQSAREISRRISREVNEALHPQRGDPDPGRLSLRITEQEANTLLLGTPEVQQTLAQQKIEDARIRMEPGQLRITGRVPVFGGFETRFSIVGNLRAENGELRHELRDVSIGSFPAPQRLTAELEKQLGLSLEQLNANLPFEVEQVQITEEAILLEGQARPGSTAR
ncbi:MAG: hypothetical protein ACK47B_08515 [Armatimonadota bacterium]